MKKDALINFIIVSLALILGSVLLWFFAKYIFACLVPFIAAYLISLGVKPCAAFLSKKLHIKYGFCSAVLICAVITALTAGASWLISALVSQGRGLAVYLAEKLGEEDNFLRRVFEMAEDLKSFFSFRTQGAGSPELAESLYSALIDVAERGFSHISSSLASFATSFIGGMPSFIFGVITTLIALFYICADKGSAKREISLLIGERALAAAEKFKVKVLFAAGKYVKSYMLIMLVTFSELLLGFVALRVEYALVLAFIIALVDLLPVLGAGTVLVPWSIFSFVLSDVRRGVGLLVLWLIMYVVRQFIEPRIIGSAMGINPLVSLFFVYAGFVLFGVLGIFLFPIMVYLVKAAFGGEEKER